MCPYYLDGDLTGLDARSVIPVATAAYRYAVAVATVQFSRAAERALGQPIGTRADRRAPVSQNSTACSASSPAKCRATRGAAAARSMRDDSWAGQVRSTF
jgi:hypothetical protein